MKHRLILALGILLLCAAVVLAAISVIQGTSGQTSGTATTITPAATGVGNLLVVFVYEDASSSSTLSVTDGASNTYSTAACNTVNTSKACLFYAKNAASTTSIICHSTTSATLPCIMNEISGVATGSPLDGTAVAGNSASGTTLTSGALTTTNANDILVYGVGNATTQSSWTVGSGFSVTPNTGLGNSTRATIQWEIVSATQSGVTTSNSWPTSATDRNSIFAAFSTVNIGGKPPGQFPRVY